MRILIATKTRHGRYSSGILYFFRKDSNAECRGNKRSRHEVEWSEFKFDMT